MSTGVTHQPHLFRPETANFYGRKREMFRTKALLLLVAALGITAGTQAQTLSSAKHVSKLGLLR